MSDISNILNLPSPSLLSFQSNDSTPTLSISYRTTTTSTSYVRGIGATSGKMILALGKRTLQGIEYLDLKRRTVALSRHFPHSNDARIKNIEEKYEELLELSRPGIGYPAAVQSFALSLLLPQILSGQTKHLAQALIKWPAIDIKLFVASLMTTSYHDMDDLVIPLIDFIVEAASLDTWSCFTLLQADILNVLLYFYTRSALNHDHYIAVHKACQRLANVCTQDDRCRQFSSEHPLIKLGICQDMSLSSPASFDQDTLTQRGEAWRSAPKNIVRHRVDSISVALRRSCTKGQLSEWLTDLVEFTDSTDFGEDISFLGFVVICQTIPAREQIMELLLKDYFHKTPARHRSKLFIHLIHRCMMLFQEPVVIPYNYDRHFLRRVVVYHLLPLFCALAESSDECLHGLLHAGMLDLLWAILFLDTSYFDMIDRDVQGCLRSWGLLEDDDEDAKLSNYIIRRAAGVFIPGLGPPTNTRQISTIEDKL